LRLAGGAVSTGIGNDCRFPGVAVLRIEVCRNTAGQLTKRRQIAGDDRNPHSKRFGKWEPVAFGFAWEEQGSRTSEMARELFIGTSAELDDVPAQLFAAVEQPEDLVSLPPALANDDETWRGRTKSVDQPRPDFQQEQVVLPRLDGADDDERWPLGLADCLRRGKRINAQRRHESRRLR